MKHLDFTKKIWAITNAIFVLNYSIYLLLFVVKLPVPYLPPLVNIVLLIISYTTSLTKFFKSPSCIPTQPNFYCILVFFSLPNNILLLPFYLLSLYHLVSFVLSNKNVYEKYFIYKLCVIASSFHVTLGKLALLFKILCVPLSFFMFLFGFCSIGTFLTYFWMVRQQYQNIPAMRSVFGELRLRLDGAVCYLPDNVQYFYIKTRDLMVHYHHVMNE